VPVTVRDTRGREIDGACGQLAATVTGRSVGPARRRLLTLTPTPASA
jgi:23S rRNA (adenine2503-C2)-methyltransferase